MKVKTYGVPDLTEWHGKVKAGSLEVAVSFTGGTASPSGAQPAYFMTKDPIVQFVIENSKEYKNGFIILVMSQDIAGEHPRMAVPKPKPQTTPSRSDNASQPVIPPVKPSEEPPTTNDEEQQNDGEDAEGNEEDEADDNKVEVADKNKVEVADKNEVEVADKNEVEVADKNEAIEYLKEHFADKNYTATSLRTKTAFEAACKECGVEFVFTA